MTTAPDSAAQGVAIWCCELELAGDGGLDAPIAHGAAHRTARVLIRLHGQPLGYRAYPMNGAAPGGDAIRADALSHFQCQIREHLAAEGLQGDGSASLPAPTPACPTADVADRDVTVVVCTRNRAAQLTSCLERLRALTYERLEILVVDNAPTDDSTRELVETLAAADRRFRYVCEPRPGLSCARNRGLQEAGTGTVLYTDDDVWVDPRWVHGLVRGFRRREDVGCVTGLVCTATIASAAEAYFDARTSSWNGRLQPELFDLDPQREVDALYPYSAGVFGTGASFGFDRDLMLRLGGFDEALGAGTLTNGGEDLDAFVRVLRAGRAIAYEPSAVVWHHHRADDDALRTQMFGYGTGLTAYLTKCLLSADTRGDVLRRVPLGARRVMRIQRETGVRLVPQVTRPSGAFRSELAGFAAGPVRYLRAARRARRAAAAASR